MSHFLAHIVFGSILAFLVWRFVDLDSLAEKLDRLVRVITRINVHVRLEKEAS